MSKCAFDFRTTHGKNKTGRFDTEGFVPFFSLCGHPYLPSVLLVEQEVYYQYFASMKNVYICQKPMSTP